MMKQAKDQAKWRNKTVVINGVFVKAWMILKDWKMRRLAKKAQIDYSTLSQAMHGRPMKTRTAGRVAQAMGVPLDRIRKP